MSATEGTFDFGTLLVGTVAVSLSVSMVLLILKRLLRGQNVIAAVSHSPVSWSGTDVCVAFMIMIGMQLGGVMLIRSLLVPVSKLDQSILLRRFARQCLRLCARLVSS